MATSTERTERHEPQVEDIERVIDRIVSGLFKAWKTILIIAFVGILFWAIVLPNIQGWLQYIMYGAFMLFQLLFAVLFMIVQFAALFWFLARGRVYWVMPGETGVGFADYKGNPEVLESAQRVVTLLRGVKEFKQMGGEMTKGILLLGPPGTGKSYLAQCISTEAGVPFGYLSAPSMQNMFMGIGNLRVMMLYNKARKLSAKYGACILFIDEIDAIGGSRGGAGGGMPMGAMGGMFGGGSGLLNELLIQMDPPPSDQGWREKLARRLGLRRTKAKMPPVLTMGATNLAEVLDQALLRPGRFDRKIVVDPPDFDGRKEVIDYYLSKVTHDDFSLDRLAYDTIGYTPASIKFVINEAVISAHFNGRSKFDYSDWLLALENHELGLRHPIKNMSAEDKRRLAYHEAGHAVAQALLLPKDKVHKVTIIRHGTALGLSQSKPLQEQYTASRDEIFADIQIALASRAAEELFLGVQLNGVSSDLQQATAMAQAAVGLWGMDGTLVSMAGLAGGPAGAGVDRGKLDKMLREQFIRVKQLIDDNRDMVVAVAETLLQKLELNADEVEQIIREVRERKALGKPIHVLESIDAPVSDLDLLGNRGGSNGKSDGEESGVSEEEKSTSVATLEPPAAGTSNGREGNGHESNGKVPQNDN